jgi:serine/threonine protein kinase
MPLCEEALLMVSLRHHPNLISLRFVKVSGKEFLVTMDLVEGTMNLSKAAYNGTLWDPVCGGQAAWSSGPPREHISAYVAMLWYQLTSALVHFHDKGIMHCDVKPDVRSTILKHSFSFPLPLFRLLPPLSHGASYICDFSPFLPLWFLLLSDLATHHQHLPAEHPHKHDHVASIPF